MNSFEKGREGENLACVFLEKSGYEVIRRNYRGGNGEIDLIAKTGGKLVFVEVKSWKTVPFSEAGYSISRRKKARLACAAGKFIFENRAAVGGLDLRFDLIFIEIKSGKIIHIENILTETG